MSKKRSNYMKRADAVFSKLVRARDGSCRACGSTEWLQCAHIHSRSYKATRCDFDNAVALCRSCHTKFTHRPIEWEDWVREHLPGVWDEMRVRALSYERVDWQLKLAELQELARAQGVAA